MNVIEIQFYGDFDVRQTKTMVGDKDPAEIRDLFEERLPTLLHGDEAVTFDAEGGGYPDTYRSKGIRPDQLKHQFIEHLRDHGYKELEPDYTIRFTD